MKDTDTYQNPIGWSAWVNLMPGIELNPTLHVSGGTLLAPNSCYKGACLEHSNSITTPETIPLRVEWKIEGENCLMIIRPVSVDAYEEPFLGGKTTVLVELPDGTTISLPIQEVHK